MLGGGQLGRMFAVAASRLGYRVRVFSPEKDPPAGHVCCDHVFGDYADVDALRRFASGLAVVSLEFENIPVSAVSALETVVPVRPAGPVLHTSQHRLREKEFLARKGIPVAPFRAVRSEADLAAAVDELGGQVVLKTAELGYDGKGQRMVNGRAEVAGAWAVLQPSECIAEQRIELAGEVSCVIARGTGGELAVIGVFGNTHSNHILDTTLFPAPLSREQREAVEEMARSIATHLEYVGVLCIEYFVDSSGNILVNELAPRPHNSGHVTIEATTCSQFEQQVRAVCGLPLGKSAMVSPGAMVNLLGDRWGSSGPDWEMLGKFPDAALHLYGKTEARPGRKMGHITVLRATAAEAATYAQAAREAFGPH